MSKVIYKLADDISTDIIYPGRFMATVLPTETPEFAFADITELNKMLVSKTAPQKSVIVAGKNFRHNGKNRICRYQPPWPRLSPGRKRQENKRIIGKFIFPPESDFIG